MHNPFQRYHIIRNFPKRYSFLSKIKSNLFFMLAYTVIRQRKNLLSAEDVKTATMKLEEGDIVLLGHFKFLFTLFFREPLTHIVLYVGEERFIQAAEYGVGYISLHTILAEYDTLVILRVPKSYRRRKKIIEGAIKYARDNLQKPYDFKFEPDDDAMYCTELVNDAYLSAGYDTGLKDLPTEDSFIYTVEKSINPTHGMLHAIWMFKGNFELVFHSHNILIVDGELVLSKS